MIATTTTSTVASVRNSVDRSSSISAVVLDVQVDAVLQLNEQRGLGHDNGALNLEQIDDEIAENFNDCYPFGQPHIFFRSVCALMHYHVSSTELTLLRGVNGTAQGDRTVCNAELPISVAVGDELRWHHSEDRLARGQQSAAAGNCVC